MRIHVLTLFPEMFSGPLSASILKRAREKGLVEYVLVQLRDFTDDRHRTADDRPYGGGEGMVMKPEPILRALDSLGGERGRVILLSPRGGVFNQERARRFSREEALTLICGHYEGVDERVRLCAETEEVSVGDYILSGGEAAALVVMDAVVRLVPGVLGNPESVRNESFADFVLEHPQYTRPAEFRGMRVPEVLLSGNHEEVTAWRRREALRRTLDRRPDLLSGTSLSKGEEEFLKCLRNRNKDAGG